MNGEIPSVPITTLAGITSLTDLLPELPLPTPLPQTMNNKSLLYHPNIAEDARRLLAGNDENLISQLAFALSQTNVDHIELKDSLLGDAIEGDVPNLLKAVLAHNPNIFKGGRRSVEPLDHQKDASGQSSQQHSPYVQQSPQQPFQQGGQTSPYPASPARYPQQSSAPSPYSNQNSPYQSPTPAQTQNRQGQHAGSSSKYQQQCKNFTQSDSSSSSKFQQPSQKAGHSPAAVNGSTSGSPGVSQPPSVSPPQAALPRRKSSSLSKPATVSSPAHAAAAPTSKEPSNSTEHSSESQRPKHREKEREHHRSNRERDKEGHRSDREKEREHRRSDRDEDKEHRRGDRERDSDRHRNDKDRDVGQKRSEKDKEHSSSVSYRDKERVKHRSEKERDRDRGHHRSDRDKERSRNQQNSTPTVEKSSRLSSSREPVVILEPLPDQVANKRLRTSSSSSSSKLHSISTIPKASSETPSRRSSTSSKVDKLSANPKVMLKPLSPEALQSASVKVSRNNSSGHERRAKKRPQYFENSDDDDDYSVVSDTSSRDGKSRKSSKEELRRGSKRRRSSDDEEYQPLELDHATGEFSASLSERVKRRRRQVHLFGSNDKAGKESSDGDSRSATPIVKEVPKEKKRREKKYQKRTVQALLSQEELMETATFKRFSNAIDYLFEGVDEADLTLDMDDEDISCPPDLLIGKSQLSDMVSEAAKLKAQGLLNQMPQDKLVKLLNILHWNIRDGAKILPGLGGNVDEDEDEGKLWKELTMERVVRSVEASLTALYIMTSPNMPKEVYIEDVIERIVNMAKFQMTNSVYPEFDPVYRLDPTAKDGYSGNIKMKRARAGQVKSKGTLTLYNKLSELVGTLGELISIQELTDTLILQVSTLGVAPFFVENISELQLNALKLVTAVFSNYEKHRQLILEDLLASLARLPSSKRNLRNFRLNSEESIQMMTALVLNLIQSVVELPKLSNDKENEDAEEAAKKKNAADMDMEVVIVTSYETSMRTAHNFLTVFLKKCAMKGEEDYRPLFENFVQDLLATVNKPEWPAAELILSLLGRLLVQQFSNKHVEMATRVASLDYLGIIAARLRKDALSSELDPETVDEILDQLNDVGDSDTEQNGKKSSAVDGGDQHQLFQKAMLDYLVYHAQSDPALVFARKFYIAQWYRDSTVEAEKVVKSKASKDSSDDSSDEDYDEDDDDRGSRKKRKKKKGKALVEENEKNEQILQTAERRRLFLVSQISTKVGAFASYKPPASKLDYENSCFVARSLASNRPFSQSFDIYLTQILKVLNETAVAVRTKAMKCLTMVIEADPGVLARNDMQRGVHARLLDQSTSVREAAVELVGKFILIRPDLIEQYYDMLSERILDTGISVRKRVIKIFRDICIEQTDFKKIPEMCVRIIRRVNDEEGIKKLVNEVFQNMWFTVIREKDSHKLLQKVVNITDVVSACRDSGYEWLEQLLENLLKKEEDSSHKPVNRACEQIVDCLVDNVLSLEERSAEGDSPGGSSARLVACLATLYLFTKIQPMLMVAHATTLQPYLNIKCVTQGDYMVLHNVARILELAVPLMDHPSEGFLAQLEEDMMKLILKHGMMVLQSCVSCLGAVVNEVTHNYRLVRDCFGKFFGVISKLMSDHKKDPKSRNLVVSRPTLLRSLFTVGLLCKHFDFDAPEMGEKKVSIRDRVFDVLMYFVDSHENEDVEHKALSGVETSEFDEEIRMKAVSGLGFLCIRHYELMLGPEVKELYHYLLTSRDASIKLKCQVLRNLQNYLTEEELKMMKADAEWKKVGSREDLKEMGDIQSGMASTIMQVYLKQVLESFLHSNSQVRMTALHVICLILNQGLVHPVQCVPYLVCMGTDCDSNIRIKADQTLKEIDRKYPGFIQMKAMVGVKMSYRLQTLLQQDLCEPIRGIRIEETPQALNAFLYSLVRGNRGTRRAHLTSLLNLFDDTAKTPLSELVFVADNLAYFPYQTQDEPLYVMHQIDIIVSVSGSNLLQSFKEGMTPTAGKTETTVIENGKSNVDYDDDDDVDTLLERLPEDVTELQTIMRTSHGCTILLNIKQHLKEMYGFTDNKIHRYSPTESAKIFDKALNRKVGVKLNIKSTLDMLRLGTPPPITTDKQRKKLIEDYLDFKDLMLSIDPADEDDDEEDVKSGRGTPGRSHTPVAGQGGPPEDEATKDGIIPTQGEDPDVIEISGGEGDGASTRGDASGHSTQIHEALTSKELHKAHHRSRERRKGRSSGSTRKHTPKPVKKKKAKKKRWRVIDSDEDSEEDDSDPDYYD